MAEKPMDPPSEDAWSWTDGRECTVSSVAELRAALAHAARDRTTTIRLEAGAYELDAVLEVERGARVCLEGPEELPPAPETADHRLAVGAVACGLAGWRAAPRAVAVAASCAVAAELARWWRRRGAAAARRSPAPAARLEDSWSGALRVAGGGTRVSLRRVEVRGCGGDAVAVDGAALRAARCVISCQRGHGVVVAGGGSLALADCVVRNCASSGVVVAAGTAAARETRFARCRRFGLEAQGGGRVRVEDCAFADGGICVSDREGWAAGADVRVDRCVVEGQAACLPGISVIGDRVPDVAVRDTTVRGVNGTGVYCLGGRVSLANCDVRAALMAGVEALRSSRVEIRASRVCRNRGGGVVAHAGATCAAFGTTIAENRGGGNVGCFDAATCRLEDCDVAGAVGAMSVHCSRATMTLKNTRVGARDPGGPGVVVSGADSRTNRAKMKLVKAPPSRLYVSGGVLNSLMVAMHPRQDPGDAPWAALFAERTRLLAPLALRAPTAGSLDGVACGADEVAPGLGLGVADDASIGFWRGATRLPWSRERLLHVLARDSALSRLHPAVLRSIADFAS